MPTRTTRPALARLLAALALVALATGCNLNDRLLSATDPDLINPKDLQSPEGADALRIGALARFRDITAGDNGNGYESTWLFGGLLADEWATASTYVQNDEVDERRTKLDNSTVTYAFRKLHRVRTAANQALAAMRQFRPTETTKMAELYLARGFAELQLASDFCNGIPLSDAAGTGEIVWGKPLTVAQLFDVAAATLDSGITTLGTPASTDADGIAVGYALRVAKARAYLGNDRVSEAGALMAGIPTSFSYNHTFLASSGSNAIWGQPYSGRRYNVGDSIEGNSRNIVVAGQLPFFSAQDPRLPASFTITVKGSRADTTRSQDGQTLSRTTPLYGQETAVAVANGIDARLIEAEAKLRAGDAAGMLQILNALRASPPKLGTVQPAAMPALTDPGSSAAQVDLLFREKAFWTFSRGQRLGDLRRLIRFYGHTANQVFPNGQHYRGGTYGDDVNLPVPQQEQNNPNFKGCVDRKA